MTIGRVLISARRNRLPLVVGLGIVGLVVIILAEALLAPNPTGRFSPTGPMNAARAEHTATLLADGRVLVAGGLGPGTSPSVGPLLSSAELYDPKTGTFGWTGSMTYGREGHTATLLADGRVLIVGGSGLASAELYDPASGTFSATGSMASAREHYTATLLADGRVLITGGDDTADGGAVLASAELYDPATGIFSPTGSMTQARTWHTATRLADGRVLVAGGDDASSSLASAELYDPVTGTFRPTGSMIDPREQHTATFISDGRVLIAGGAAFDRAGRPLGNGPLTTAELYDPKLGTFSATGSMTFTAEFNTTTLLSDGRVLFAGGDDGMASLASAQLYDPKTGNFSSAGSMTTGREGDTATLLADGRVLIAGGQAAGNTGSGAPVASAELYQP